MYHLTVKTASLVLLGVFDIRSFTPTALFKNGVLTESDAISASNMMIVPNRISRFEIEKLKVNAQPERLEIEASAPPYVKLADIASKAIRENKDFPTKVVAIGINLHAYFMFDNYDMRDRLGRRLAPINVWGKWSEQLEKADSYPADDPRHSGMMSLVMRLPNIDDRMSGYVDVRVEPSLRLKAPEVFLSINDHYGLPLEPEKAEKVEPLALLETVENRFDQSMQKSDEIMESILGVAK